jgi:ATP adenylyltransferase
VAGLEHLWAGWRAAYLDAVTTDDGSLRPDASGSLFERILSTDLPDDQAYVVHRGAVCSTILNLYPYTNGHLLVLPNRAVTDLEALDPDEHRAFWDEVRDAVVAVKTAYGCDGVNVGLNLGAAAGAGVPDHLHAHVLPRWAGDTNFMTAVAETRVMPEPLDASWRRLHDAWPR